MYGLLCRATTGKHCADDGTDSETAFRISGRNSGSTPTQAGSVMVLGRYTPGHLVGKVGGKASVHMVEDVGQRAA